MGMQVFSTLSVTDLQFKAGRFDWIFIPKPRPARQRGRPFPSFPTLVAASFCFVPARPLQEAERLYTAIFEAP